MAHRSHPLLTLFFSFYSCFSVLPSIIWFFCFFFCSCSPTSCSCLAPLAPAPPPPPPLLLLLLLSYRDPSTSEMNSVSYYLLLSSSLYTRLRFVWSCLFFTKYIFTCGIFFWWWFCLLPCKLVVVQSGNTKSAIATPLQQNR